MCAYRTRDGQWTSCFFTLLIRLLTSRDLVGLPLFVSWFHAISLFSMKQEIGKTGPFQVLSKSSLVSSGFTFIFIETPSILKIDCQNRVFCLRESNIVRDNAAYLQFVCCFSFQTGKNPAQRHQANNNNKKIIAKQHATTTSNTSQQSEPYTSSTHTNTYSLFVLRCLKKRRLASLLNFYNQLIWYS